MSTSFTNQTLAQIALWNEDFKGGVHVLPKNLDEEVARLRWRRAPTRGAKAKKPGCRLHEPEK